MVKLNKSKSFILPAALLALLLYTGVFPVNFKMPYVALVQEGSVCALSGKVVSTPVKISGVKNSYRVNVSLDSVRSKSGLVCNASGIVEVFVPASLCEIYSPGKLYSAWRGKKENLLIDAGAQIEFDVIPKPAKDFKNGGTKTEFQVVNIKRCVWQQNNLWKKIQKTRALSRLHFTRLMYAWGAAGGFILALLSGSREYLARGLSEAFRNAGLSHILALSGMHLSLFSGIALFVGRKSVGKKFAPVLELVAVLVFFWFAGKSPSLFRALLCSLIITISAMFRIKVKSMLNVLALCFLIHVALFPADMFEMSFMLSYGALAGILCINEFVSKPLSRALPFTAGSSLGQSAGAQFFTAPICLRYFKMITPGGIIASVVLSPLVTIFVYVALAFIALCLVCPFCAPLCGSVLSAFYFILEKSVLVFAGIPQLRF